MSNCARIRAAILEADLPELEGAGDTGVARHVRTCASCARLARHIVKETSRLDQALGCAPAVRPDDIVRRAGLGGGTSGGTRPRRRWAWISVATAAALAGALLLSRQGVPTAPPEVRRAVRPPALVESATRDVAIIETDNPDIVVLWFFGEE